MDRRINWPSRNDTRLASSCCPLEIVLLSACHGFLGRQYFISRRWISQPPVVRTLDRIYVSWRYTRNRWTLGLDLYGSVVSMKTIESCPLRISSDSYTLASALFIPPFPLAFHIVATIFGHWPTAISTVAFQRISDACKPFQPSRHMAAFLFTERPINVCGRGFPVHSSSLWQRSDFVLYHSYSQSCTTNELLLFEHFYQLRYTIFLIAEKSVNQIRTGNCTNGGCCLRPKREATSLKSNCNSKNTNILRTYFLSNKNLRSPKLVILHIPRFPAQFCILSVNRIKRHENSLRVEHLGQS